MRHNESIVLLATIAAAAVWVLSAQAQVIDADACESECREQSSSCVSACGDGDDPVECEGQCEDQREDCLEACGD